jgi:hypothetical protein
MVAVVTPAPDEPSVGHLREPAGGAKPRELRSLVPFEVAAVVALAIVPLPELVPVALPLLVAASASRWARGRPWSEVLRSDGWTVAVAAAAGLAALAIALVAGTPLVERMTRSTVEWSVFPVVRGSPGQLFAVALVVIAMAIASELALRGWVVERLLELAPGPPVLPVLLGAIAEGLVTPGDAWVRIGAVAFGLGLGWMYVAGGRNAAASIGARVAFSLTALVLEGLQIIG